MRHLILIALSVACTNSWAADAVTKQLSSENGRYAFGQISETRKDQFMLDTKTGRLWNVVLQKLRNQDGSEVPGGTITVLEPVMYTNNNGALTQEPK